jgi:probable LLM family oxidoreductase
MSISPIELGLDTFGAATVDAKGDRISYAQVIRNIVDQGVLADAVGIDHFGVGEHHRDDFAVSAPEIVLTAIAARTDTIRLGSSVTVLSSDDPVRVYQRFATLDAISNGRAEVTLGRGSFTESFPLFGFDLRDYESLFEEKLDLIATLRSEGPITWAGTTRAPLSGQRVYPTTAAGSLPLWVGVGGSSESVVRAASHGMPMMLAIIGGSPQRFRPFVDLYRAEAKARGFAGLPVGVHSGGFVADTDQEAMDTLYPFQKAGMDRIGRERGWPPLTRERFEDDVAHGSSYVGSPETVAKKIAATIEILGVDRFDLKYDSGAMPHELLMRSIELYGREVIPRVREILAEQLELRSLSASEVRTRV